jgi:hypothetical protein
MRTRVHGPVALDPDAGDPRGNDGACASIRLDFHLQADADSMHLEEAAAEGGAGKTRFSRLREELAALDQHVCVT